MDINELKFLLKLLGFPNYRASFTAFSSVKGKDKILQDLGDRELVDYTREIATVQISGAGQTVLKDPTQVPITDKELKVLEKISKAAGKIAPSQIKVSSLKAADKEAILNALKDRDLIEHEIKRARNKVEVTLTERGIEQLRDHYDPEGQAKITLDLLNNYVRFLRKTLRVKPETDSTALPPVISTGEKISDEGILLFIAKLDRELGTDNYLPIFHLREKLQPPFSKDELDQALYRLEEANRIELSTLAEPRDYTLEQIDAGISQISGGSLFFITVN